MSLPRTQDGKVVLYDASTGERFARWPIDAREMLATGAYTTDTLQVTSAVATVAVAVRDEHRPAISTGALMSPTGAPLVIGKAIGIAQPMQFPASSSSSRRRR